MSTDHQHNGAAGVAKRACEVVELAGFSACGLSVELTPSQNENSRRISQLWQNFNRQLRAKNHHGGRDWVKYGITQKIQDGHSYTAAVPFDGALTGFEKITIANSRFARFQHTGALSHMKSTFNSIYRVTIPNSDLIIEPERTLVHFERYDRRFHWSRNDSKIDIFVPLTDRN